MVASSLLRTGIAWIAAPARDTDATSRNDSTKLRLVFAAAVIEQARRHRKRSPEEVRRHRRTSI